MSEHASCEWIGCLSLYAITILTISASYALLGVFGWRIWIGGGA